MYKFITNYRWQILLFPLFPLFFLGGPGYESSRLFKEIWNLGHILFFAIFALEANRYLIARHLPCRKNIITILLIILTLATGIEACQSFIPGRVASLQDIIFGLAGGLVTIAWKSTDQQSLNRKLILRAVAISTVALCMMPLIFVAVGEYRAWHNFPVLSDFESFLDVSRWKAKGKVTRVREPVKNGQYALKVSLTTEKYSGIALTHFPENWSNARALTFSIYNPGDMVTLHYRIHDWKHRGKNQDYSDRFNGHSNLHPGWNTITIGIKDIINGPKNRKNDIEHIRGFSIFLIDQTVARVIYMDDVQLLLIETSSNR